MSPPETTTRPDDITIAAVVRGDAEAIDRWYRAEFPIAFRISFGVLDDPTEAEDVAQDAMIRLLDRLPRRDTDKSYPAWRTAVVVNLCRDRYRRAETRRRIERRSAKEAPLPRRLPDPGDDLDQRELRELINGALAKLPPREREVFVLRDLEGLPTLDAADALGLGASSVRSLLSLARRRIRDLIAPRLRDASGEGALT